MKHFFNTDLSKHLLFIFTLTLFTSLHAQEGKIDMHGDQAKQKIALYYGEVLEVIPAGKYTYLKVDEKGQNLWIAISAANVSVGDTIGFDKQTLMQNFQSKTLHKTFERIYFVSELQIPKKKTMSMKEMLHIPTKEN